MNNTVSASISNFNSVVLPSVTFKVIHAIVTSFTIKLSSILMGYGGGIFYSIITSNPMSLFLSPNQIPICIIGALLVEYTPVKDVLYLHAAQLEPFFDLVDAISRGGALAKNINRFRNMEYNGLIGRDSMAGQLIVGVISITAGGLSYRWILCNQTMQIGSWIFNVMVLCTVLIIAIFEIQECLPSSAWFGVKTILQSCGIELNQITMDELIFGSICFMWFGMLIRPQLSSIQLKKPLTQLQSSNNSVMDKKLVESKDEKESKTVDMNIQQSIGSEKVLDQPITPISNKPLEIIKPNRRSGRLSLGNTPLKRSEQSAKEEDLLHHPEPSPQLRRSSRQRASRRLSQTLSF
ncbi:hypothetical protein HDV02_004511 [Globomyces sp. JEL0801]|nr:hypothetical protein HDV02_004511 [Globomyces sp. JEL0801]